jgi:hypothetical protein
MREASMTEPDAAGRRNADMSIAIELPCTVMTGPSTPPLIHLPLRSNRVAIAATFVQVELFDHLMMLGA